MSDIDDGLKIKIGGDFDPLETDISRAEMSLDQLLDRINKRLEEQKQIMTANVAMMMQLPENMAKSFQGFFQAIEDQRNDRIDAQNKEEAERKRQLEFERQRRDEERQRLRQQEQQIEAFKSLGAAITGVAAAGASLKEALNFTSDLNHLDLFLKSVGGNLERFIQLRNVLRKRGLSDQESVAFLNQVNEEGNRMKNWQTLPEEERRALQILAKYDPALIDPKNNMRSDERMLRKIRAAHQFSLDNKNLDHSRQVDFIKAGFGGSQIFAEIGLQGLPQKELDKEAPNAKKIAGSVDKARELFQAKQAKDNTREAALAGTIADISPLAVQFFDSLNRFLDKHGEMAMMIKLLGEFGVGVLGIVGTLKFALGAGGLGAFLKSSPAAIPAAAPDAAAGSVGLIPWLLGTFGIPVAASITQKGSTFETEEQKKTRFQKISEAKSTRTKALSDNKDTISKIEHNLGVKVDYSLYNSKFFIADRKGNFLFYMDDINQSFPQLKEKIDKTNKPSKWNPLSWIFPQAHGEERHSDIAPSSRPSSSSIVSSTRSSALTSYHAPTSNMAEKEAFLTQMENKYNLPPGLLDAVWLQESGRGKQLRSGAGAEGDFQFIPSTARQYGVDTRSFPSSAEGAAKFLRDLLNRNGNNVGAALGGYNWREGTIRQLRRKYGDDWIKYAPAETQRYVPSILNNMRINQARMQPQPSMMDIATQSKIAQQINNNTTHNAANTANNNNVTINIHAPGGNPNAIKSAVQQGLSFPKVGYMNGVSGVS